MIQFDIRRFGRLARWTLATEGAYYRRLALQLFAVVFLLLMFLSRIQMNGDMTRGYEIAVAMMFVMLIACVVMGPAFMFQGMTGRHARQTLLTLPASNLEKYLVRYATWMLVLVLAVIAIVVADQLQYVVYWLLGNDGRRWLVSVAQETIGPRWGTWSERLDEEVLSRTVSALFWLHSCYALGATFFRMRKYGWVLTTMVLVVLGILGDWLLSGFIPIDNAGSAVVIAPVMSYLVLSILNFWLSYRLFCRMQIAGRFFNI